MACSRAIRAPSVHRPCLGSLHFENMQTRGASGEKTPRGNTKRGSQHTSVFSPRHITWTGGLSYERAGSPMIAHFMSITPARVDIPLHGHSCRRASSIAVRVPADILSCRGYGFFDTAVRLPSLIACLKTKPESAVECLCPAVCEYRVRIATGRSPDTVWQGLVCQSRAVGVRIFPSRECNP